MKKSVMYIIISVVIIAVFIFGFVASIPLVNDFTAKNVEDSLLDIELPEDTELVESLSEAGKFVGNGNGMQYFGAILLKSELSVEELNTYYSEKLDGAVVREQESQTIDFIQIGTISFETEINENDDYYIVYRFGSGVFPFSDLDIRGH